MIGKMERVGDAQDIPKLGFSHSNLIDMRLFLEFQISETTSRLFLSWSHYVELLKIQDKLERSFYEK